MRMFLWVSGVRTAISRGQTHLILGVGAANRRLGAAQGMLGTGLRAIYVLNSGAVSPAFNFTFNLQVLLKLQESGKNNLKNILTFTT